MKKSELKSGMIIETRAGRMATVFISNSEWDKEGVIVFSENNWTGLKDFSDDLIWHFGREHSSHAPTVDIMKVYEPSLPSYALSRDTSKMKLIWERKEAMEMTLVEVCRLLGKEIKIIK